VRAAIGGVLIAVTLLTSVSNAQPTPDAQPTPQTPLPTATPAAPNTAPPPSPSQQQPPQQAKTTSSKRANVQRLPRPGQRERRRTRALGSWEREARACIRHNIPMLYESGVYGGDQAISFFKRRCLYQYSAWWPFPAVPVVTYGPDQYSRTSRQPGFSELAESRFAVIVTQEVSPESPWR
jgi:hypothetical protein